MSFGLSTSWLIELSTAIAAESPSSLALARDPPLLRHFWSRLMKLARGRQRGFNDLGALR